VVSSTPRPHFTPGKDPVPILQQAGWAPGAVWPGRKSRPHRLYISTVILYTHSCHIMANYGNIYYITVLIYSCVLTEYNTIYKFVTTQRDDFCQKNILKRMYLLLATHILRVYGMMMMMMMMTSKCS